MAITKEKLTILLQTQLGMGRKESRHTQLKGFSR